MTKTVCNRTKHHIVPTSEPLILTYKPERMLLLLLLMNKMQ